jgi:anti-sigma B factor antagonist
MALDIQIQTIRSITTVQLAGEIDGSTAPDAQAKIVPLATADTKLVLDMSNVAYMSSAGLRMLLVIYRSVAGHGGKVVVVGLSETLKDTMSLTGFLDFFDHYDTLEAGLAALNPQGV